MKALERARKQFKAVQQLNHNLPGYLRYFTIHSEESVQDPFRMFSDVSEWTDSFFPSEDIDYTFDNYKDWSYFKAKKASESNEITVYSLFPIENGSVVSPSKVWMEDIGEAKYSKTVKLDDVLWMDPFLGQVAYLPIETQKI